MNASEVYGAMSGSARRITEVMRTSRAEVVAMRRRLAVLRWVDVNDPETPRWWQA